MLNLIASTLALVLLSSTQTGGPSAPAVVDAYIRALGGEETLRRVTSRVTEGQFDNGRGLRETFTLLEKAANKRVTLIGRRPIESDEGSGRGYDGTAGWDKNFVGTGLRALDGAELTDAARDADFLRPLHVPAECPTLALDGATPDTTTLRCARADGHTERWSFARGSGLLTRKDVALERGGTLTVHFEDYRSVDGVRVPFLTRVVLPNGTVVRYAAERVRHNEPIEDGVFARPKR